MSTPLIRVCAVKGTNSVPGCGDLAAAQVELLLRERHDAAALGRLVGERGELGRVRELLHRDTRAPG